MVNPQKSDEQMTHFLLPGDEFALSVFLSLVCHVHQHECAGQKSRKQQIINRIRLHPVCSLVAAI